MYIDTFRRFMATAAVTAAMLAGGAVSAQFRPDAVLMKPPERGRGADAPPPSDPRDFEGVWLGQQGGEPPPWMMGSANLTEKAKKELAYSREMNAKGTPLATLAAHCRPMEAQMVGRELFPSSITQNAKQMVILNEEGRSRWTIYLDRDHPRKVTPSYWGDSVGHWEGDTLVIDTVGFNGLDSLRSKEARIITRLRKIENGRKLEIKQSTIDPVNYIHPTETTRYSLWRPDLQLLDFQCEENMEGAMEGMTKH